MEIVVVKIDRSQDLSENVNFENTGIRHFELGPNHISNVFRVPLIEFLVQTTLANQVVCAYLGRDVLESVLVGLF